MLFSSAAHQSSAIIENQNARVDICQLSVISIKNNGLIKYILSGMCIAHTILIFLSPHSGV